MNVLVRLLLCFALSLLAGCSSQYGPPFDASHFGNAATARDGRVGVFSMKRLIYRPAAGLLAFPDGGVPRYQVDRNYLVLYDFSDDSTRLLVTEDALKQPWLAGSSSFNVVAAFGPKVIVRTSGQLKKDYASYAETWWYDLDRAERSDLPLDAELAALGYALGYFYLVDNEGTLVIVATTAGDPAAQRDKRQSLLVRYPDGSYLTIGPIIDYYGLRQGELFYWSPQQQLVAVKLAGGQRRIAERREAIGLSSDPKAGQADTPTLVAQQGVSSNLAIGRRQGSGWNYTPLPLTVAEVAGDH